MLDLILMRHLDTIPKCTVCMNDLLILPLLIVVVVVEIPLIVVSLVSVENFMGGTQYLSIF